MKGLKTRLILASESRTRQDMLRRAGIDAQPFAPRIEEDKIIASMDEDDGLPPLAIAQGLAEAKALALSSRYRDALVIGADQVLHVDGHILQKAKTPDEARDKLMSLSGRTHELISAVCVAQDNEIIWGEADHALMTMRVFDPEFLEGYMRRAGSGLTKSVGAYEIEGAGAWLFESIQGDHFTILGLPLMPLLNYLQDEHGLMP